MKPEQYPLSDDQPEEKRNPQVDHTPEPRIMVA
jgi:hypothetical protein